MSHICNRTGLSRGGVYGHYAGTGQIFADIIQEIMGDLESGVEEKMQSGFSATRILDQLLARYQGEMLDHGGSLGLAFTSTTARCHPRRTTPCSANTMPPGPYFAG